MTLEVANQGAGPMPAGLGLHAYFNTGVCVLAPGESLRGAIRFAVGQPAAA